MKRAAMKRKTPLSHGSNLRRGEPLKRKSMNGPSQVRKASTDARYRSVPYVKWLRDQCCARCHGPGGDAHHVIGLVWGLSGVGLTAPDNFAMPLCRGCHTKVHASHDLQRQQPGWLLSTIERAIPLFSSDVADALRSARAFIKREATDA